MSFTDAGEISVGAALYGFVFLFLAAAGGGPGVSTGRFAERRRRRAPKR